MTFTWTVWLSTSPKPLYAAQLKVPEAFLLIFFIVSTFPSCSTPVFPWFPVFSLVQVTFGSGLPNASHVNCKLLPSWTVCSPPISVISAGTKSRKSHWKKNSKTLQRQFLIVLCGRHQVRKFTQPTLICQKFLWWVGMG